MKRIIAIILVAALLVAAYSADIFATDAEAAGPRSSTYISGYSATLSTGTQKGEVVLTFFISSGRTDLTKIGINNIVVYRENGTKVRSVGGSFENGLLKANARSYTSSYSLILTTGESYYMVITFVAGNASGVETRTFTTNVASPHP